MGAFEDGAAGDAAVFKIVEGFVDVVEAVAAGDQLIERQAAAGIPGEVARANSTSGTTSPPWLDITVFEPPSMFCRSSGGGSRQTPTSTEVPPRRRPGTPIRVARTTCCTVVGNPMVSNAKSTPPPDRLRTASTAFSLLALTVWVAPNRRAKSSFASSTSTAMTTVAPTLAAACTALRPTPPAPNTATDCPSRTPAVLVTAPAPVITAQPIMLVLTTSAGRGTGTTKCSLTRQWSAQV